MFDPLGQSEFVSGEIKAFRGHFRLILGPYRDISVRLPKDAYTFARARARSVQKVHGTTIKSCDLFPELFCAGPVSMLGNIEGNLALLSWK